MAYDKHTWTCDEPITVERLNHIEDGIANAGGDCDCGFECETTITLLTEESVTTTEQGGYNGGALSYSRFIDAETIRVTFDSVEYDCPRIAVSDGPHFYGGFDLVTETPDFSQYPFVIVSGGTNNEIATATAGTHAIKIETVEETVTTTPCFDLARGYSCSEMVEVLDDETVITVHDDKGDYNRGSIDLTLAEPFPQLTITFDNVKYECEINGNGAYGSTSYITFSEYPFQILPSGSIYTSTPGEHSVKIEAIEETITTTPCFEKAVKAVVPSDSVEVPKKAYEPKVFNLTSEGTVTVPANDDATLSFPSTGTRFSQFAVIRKIDIPNNLLINDFFIGNNDVNVNVYNITSSPITVTNAQLSLVDFAEVEATICVTEGTGCGGGK